MIKFDKLMKEVKKEELNVSIVDCMVDNGKIEYMARYNQNNSKCFYTYDKTIINKIKNIASKSNYKTLLQETKTIIPQTGLLLELFVY